MIAIQRSPSRALIRRLEILGALSTAEKSVHSTCRMHIDAHTTKCAHASSTRGAHQHINTHASTAAAGNCVSLDHIACASECSFCAFCSTIMITISSSRARSLRPEGCCGDTYGARATIFSTNSGFSLPNSDLSVDGLCSA